MGTQLPCFTLIAVVSYVYGKDYRGLFLNLDVKKLSKRQAKQVGANELTAYNALPVLFRLVDTSNRNQFNSRLFFNPYL